MSSLADHLKTGLKEVKNNIKEKHLKENLKKHWHLKRGFDRNSGEVPYLVQVTCDWLEKNALQQEGLFRISGQLNEVADLKKKLDKGKPVDLSQYNAHIIAGALKQFFIEPEESILTEELYDAFLTAVAVKDEEDRVHCVASVIHRLPVGNKMIFQRLCRLLKAAAAPENSCVSKMSTQNLAIVFAPTLLRKESQTMDSILSDSEKAKRLVEMFITSYDRLFTSKLVKKSSSKYSDEVLEFFQTLKVSTVRLTQAKLKELENLNDIAEIAKANNVSEDEVDSEMLNAFYSARIRSQTAPEQKVLKRHASQVWSDFFHEPKEESKGDLQPETLPAAAASSQPPEAEPEVTTSDVQELVKVLDEDDVDLGKVDELVTRVGKLSTVPRSRSFTDAFEKLDEMAKKITTKHSRSDAIKDVTWGSLHEAVHPHQEDE